MEPDRHFLMLYRLLANRPAVFLESCRSALASGATAEHLLREDPSLRVTASLKALADNDLQWLASGNRRLVFILDDDYPGALREIHDPPPVLFTEGDIAHWQAENSLAIVGSRKASTYGMTQAHDIARGVADAGVTVVSGLAMGIDSAAHEGALASGQSATIAVLGTGPDIVYPKRNWRLAARIRETGLLVSEFPPGTSSRPGNFPRRNRVVTGLSDATLVIEAARRSGSLVSAGLAMSQGRDVLALPGQVTQAGARGYHQLIRDGAALIECADDVLRELGLEEAGPGVLPSRPRLSGDQQLLLDCLDRGPLSMDLLCEASGLAVDELTVSLVSLEIAGLVASDGGIYQRRS